MTQKRDSATHPLHGFLNAVEKEVGGSLTLAEEIALTELWGKDWSVAGASEYVRAERMPRDA